MYVKEQVKVPDVTNLKWVGGENEYNHTTIGSALLGIEPNTSNITPQHRRNSFPRLRHRHRVTLGFQNQAEARNPTLA